MERRQLIFKEFVEMEENQGIVKRKSNQARALIFALALMLTTGIGLGAERAALAQQQPLPSPADLSRTFVGIAKQVKPAVVNIDATEEAKRTSLQRGGQSPLPIPGFEDVVPRN